MQVEKIRVFYSYAHDDAEWLPAIQECLREPRKWGWIDEWSDKRLHAGEDWDEQIRAQIESADLILMLVSQTFLQRYGCREEVGLALNLAPRSKLRLAFRSLAGRTIRRGGYQASPTIVPILLSRVDYGQTKLSHLQPAPGWDMEIALPDPRPRLELTRTRLVEVLRQMKPDLREPQDNGGGAAVPVRRVQMPKLLPHLCNRIQQGRQVRKILAAPQDHSDRRTMLVIARGPKDESHESFQVRLKLELVPAALGIAEAELQREYLNWPEEYVSPAALRSSLAATAARLDRAGTCVMVDTMIYSSNWPGEEALRVFFEFWRGWKPQHANAFVVAQFFKFAEDSQENRVLQSEAFLGYFAAAVDAEGEKRPLTSLLQPFEPVEQTEAEAWAQTAASFGVCDLLDVPALQAKIAGWYETGGTRIPMGKLVGYFESLLTSPQPVPAVTERQSL